MKKKFEISVSEAEELRDMAVREKEDVVKANLEQQIELTSLKEKVAALEQDKSNNEKQFDDQNKKIELLKQQHNEKMAVEQSVNLSLQEEVSMLKTEREESKASFQAQFDKVNELQASLEFTTNTLKASKVKKISIELEQINVLHFYLFHGFGLIFSGKKGKL